MSGILILCDPYTSGTTGCKKALLSHSNLVSNAAALFAGNGGGAWRKHSLCAADVPQLRLDLLHGTALYNGASVTIVASCQRYYRHHRDMGVTMVMSVPAIFFYIAARPEDLAGVRLFAAAPSAAEILERFHERQKNM